MVSMPEHTHAVAEEAPLRPEHAGEVLGGVAVGTLANWRWLGRGPAWIKRGGRVVYRPADLYSYLAARRRQTGDSQ
jgi:hypothetical protein